MIYAGLAINNTWIEQYLRNICKNIMQNESGTSEDDTPHIP